MPRRVTCCITASTRDSWWQGRPLQPGSPELVDSFARQIIGANDTSVAVGYAPLTETERCVLAAERRLNSPAFKLQFPEAGEDVKVMGCRQGRHLTLTIALAFVDHFLPDACTYFTQKAAIQEGLQRFLAADLYDLDDVAVHLARLVARTALPTCYRL